MKNKALLTGAGVLALALALSGCPTESIVTSTVTNTGNNTKYSITLQVSHTEWGTVECRVSEERPGNLVFLTIRPVEDYRLKKSAFQVNGGAVPIITSFEGTTLTSYKFRMPESDVTVTADFEPFSDAVILDIDFPLIGEQFDAQRVVFSASQTERVTLANLRGRSVFIAQINTSDTEIPTANIGNRSVWGGSDSAGDIDGESGFWEDGEYPFPDTYSAMRFNRDPPPLPPGGVRPPSRAAVPFVPRVVGDTRKFWVELYRNSSFNWYEINATVQAVSEHCNIWVAEENFDNASTDSYDRKITRAQAELLAQKFDLVYGPTTSLFGFEYGGGLPEGHSEYGGVDGDPRIQILVFDIPAATGFFSSSDYYPQSYLDEHSYLPGRYKSNGGEIFYLNVYQTDGGSDYIYSALIHEFQHMINFNQKNVKQGKSSSSWYDEMLSMLAEDMIGPFAGIGPDNRYHPINERIPDFLGGYPWLGITEDRYLNRAFYGKAYAFGAYLARNYGGPGLVREMASNNAVDVESVDQAIASLNSGHTFAAALERYAEAFLCTDPARGRTFNQTVTQTINGVTYTLQGFNIFDIRRSIVKPSLRENFYTASPYKGPAVFALNSVFPLDEMRKYSLVIRSRQEWQGVNGDLTIELENPLDPAVHVYLMMR
jgi:hypothetical protein